MRYTIFPGSIMPAQVYAIVFKFNREGSISAYNLNVFSDKKGGKIHT